MNKRCAVLFSLLGISLLSASEAPLVYEFQDTDLEEDRFIQALGAMTEENAAYCVWALKRDLNFCTIKDARNCEPLEIVFQQYADLSDTQLDEKKRYQKVFEVLVKAGARPATDFQNRVTDAQQLKAAELVTRGGILGNAWKLFPAAFQAIQARDIHALDTILQQHPDLVHMVDAASKKTLLHEAVEQFAVNDSASIQIFAHLIRKGADVDMPDSTGQSVALLMSTGQHPASDLFKRERASLKNQSLPSISTDQIKKLAQPLVDKARPYGWHIAGFLGVVGVIVYLVRSRQERPTQGLGATIQLQQLT